MQSYARKNILPTCTQHTHIYGCMQGGQEANMASLRCTIHLHIKESDGVVLNDYGRCPCCFQRMATSFFIKSKDIFRQGDKKKRERDEMKQRHGVVAQKGSHVRSIML